MEQEQEMVRSNGAAVESYEVAEGQLRSERESESAALSDPREAARARIMRVAPSGQRDDSTAEEAPRMILFTR